MVGADPPPSPNYREEAKRVRAVAAAVKDAQVKKQLLAIALLYDRLAEHVGQVGSAPSDKVS